METKPDIEKQVDAVMASARNVKPVEVSEGFTEGTILKMREYRKKEYSVLPALYKIAAILVLAIINIYTIRSVVSSQPQQEAAAPTQATVNDLASEYQVNDLNDELQINKTVEHE